MPYLRTPPPGSRRHQLPRLRVQRLHEVIEPARSRMRKPAAERYGHGRKRVLDLIDGETAVPQTRSFRAGTGTATLLGVGNENQVPDIQPKDFRGWPADRTGLPVGNRNVVLRNTEARSFRAERRVTDTVKADLRRDEGLRLLQ